MKTEARLCSMSSEVNTYASINKLNHKTQNVNVLEPNNAEKVWFHMLPPHEKS